MVEMADQSQQESRKRNVNFHDENKENGKSLLVRFLKSWVLQKALFTHVLQSFGDRKTTLFKEEGITLHKRKRESS